jgi:hypothetical protein
MAINRIKVVLAEKERKILWLAKELKKESHYNIKMVY